MLVTWKAVNEDYLEGPMLEIILDYYIINLLFDRFNSFSEMIGSTVKLSHCTKYVYH